MNLKNAKTFRVQGTTGGYKYLISYDYMAGRKDRYTVVALGVYTVSVIGRELTLGRAKDVVRLHGCLLDHGGRPRGVGSPYNPDGAP